MATTTTLSSIRTACYNIIKQPENCAAYPYTLLDTFINKAQNDFCYGFLSNLSTKEKMQKQNLPFLNKRTVFTSVARNTNSVALIVSGTTITMSDSSTFASSGAVWVQWQIITYSANSGTVLSGCSGITFATAAGAQVRQLYSLPTDYGQMTNAYYTAATNGVEFKMIGFDYRDYMQPQLNTINYNTYRDDYTYAFQGEFYYTLIDDTYFLPFLPQSGCMIRFEYQKKPTQLVATSDVATIPDDYVLNIIPYFATAEMLYNRGEPDIALQLNNYWFENARNAVRFYQTKQKELIYGQRVRTVSDGQVNI